jgi:hypothetical protein
VCHWGCNSVSSCIFIRMLNSQIMILQSIFRRPNSSCCLVCSSAVTLNLWRNYKLSSHMSRKPPVIQQVHQNYWRSLWNVTVIIFWVCFYTVGCYIRHLLGLCFIYKHKIWPGLVSWMCMSQTHLSKCIQAEMHVSGNSSILFEDNVKVTGTFIKINT